MELLLSMPFALGTQMVNVVGKLTLQRLEMQAIY